MYVHHGVQALDEAAALDFIDAHGFALLVGPGLLATHLPLLLDRGRRVLVGHLARANPHARLLSGTAALAVFSGPHHYVSPSWYGASPAVPTWNYGAVHVRGRAELLDEAGTLAAIHDLVRRHEPALLEPGSVLTEDLTSRLLGAVCGFSISIDGIEGKLKLGQERPVEQQRGVVAGLERLATPAARALLDLMHEHGLGDGRR